MVDEIMLLGHAFGFKYINFVTGMATNVPSIFQDLSNVLKFWNPTYKPEKGN